MTGLNATRSIQVISFFFLRGRIPCLARHFVHCGNVKYMKNCPFQQFSEVSKNKQTVCYKDVRDLNVRCLSEATAFMALCHSVNI